ncbi:huntingtin-interacting protein 1-like [Oppia nitens]|uniref:huntingtin-interacting protein 1-like n=1 Tax=Oppia nitens TaxID=1686743 RepID=UPI0023D983B7|nr:huntingtin-interacting protein 1-like [Oppia nitens]
MNVWSGGDSCDTNNTMTTMCPQDNNNTTDNNHRNDDNIADDNNINNSGLLTDDEDDYVDDDDDDDVKTSKRLISKAINTNENPVKEKHIRTIIIGTHQNKSAHLFWTIARNLRLQDNPILCWKFCHVLHKLLREGYRKTIADSYPFRPMLKDLGNKWGLLREGYGKLIQNYSNLLIRKIDFHTNNQRIPGNLMVSDEELDTICEILSLQSNVFGSLDMSRSNSMTMAGQCRLAPLIPCIQDSSQLYDFSLYRPPQ